MMNIPLFKKYHGYQSSIIPFSSGYYLYLASWDSTPTHFTSYTNLWLITPEDKRMLFSDPPASSPIVCLYHDFHEIHPTSISLDWASENHLQVECASQDGDHEFKIEFLLHETLASRFLIALASSPPTRLTVSKPWVAISNFLVDLFITGGGSATCGKTETGMSFYVAEADRVMLIKEGSAVYNGKDLGTVSKPTWPIEFGDAVPSVRAVIRLGNLYMPFEKDMLR
jgi:hypothetical protein